MFLKVAEKWDITIFNLEMVLIFVPNHVPT